MFSVLFHPDNIKKLTSILCAVIVLITTYSGTLPALLEHHKDWLDLAAYIIIGLNLYRMNPNPGGGA